MGEMGETRKTEEGTSIRNQHHTVCDMPSDDRISIRKHNRMVCRILKKRSSQEDGFLEWPIVSFGIVFIAIGMILILAIGFGGRQKAVNAYQWFGEAMNYSAQAANFDGDTSQVTLRTDDAKEYFIATFADMLDANYVGDQFVLKGTKYYPAPVKFDETSFHAVNVGESVPGGIANQPGYMAEIEVPVFKGKVPWVSQGGEECLRVPMRFFAVVKSNRIN